MEDLYQTRQFWEAKMEKIKTYSLNQDGGCELIDNKIENIIETLKVELQEAELNDDDDVIEFTIRIEKNKTQEDLDKLSDWEGF